MDKTRRVLGVGRAFLFAAVAAPALATTVPLVVGTDLDDVIINFDFSSAPTPPPYTGTMLSFFHLDVSAAPANVVFDFYDGLNGSGLLGSQTTTLPSTGSWKPGQTVPRQRRIAPASSTGSFRSAFT